jgi:hypothetical protein
MVEPIMTHQSRLRFADGSAAKKTLAAVGQLRLGEETVFGAHRTGTDIHFRCQIYDRLEGNGEIGGVPGRNEPLYFFDVLYAIDAVRAAAIILSGSFGCTPQNTPYIAGRRRYSTSLQRSTI